MIIFKNSAARVLLAALEHYRIDCTAQRVKNGECALRGAFIEQEDAAAKLCAAIREQVPAGEI